MSEPVDPWDNLSTQWQQNDSAPATDLHSHVASAYRSATTRLWASVVVEILVVVGVTLWTVSQLREQLSAIGIANLVVAWTVVFVALTFSIRNRRGIWRAEGETTAHYLALWERRAERKLRTAHFVARFVLILSAVSLLATVGQAWLSDTWAGLSSGVLTIVGILAAYLAWAFWFRARATRELAEVTALRAQLVGEPSETDL